jgi:hypothetical protein
MENIYKSITSNLKSTNYKLQLAFGAVISLLVPSAIISVKKRALFSKLALFVILIVGTAYWNGALAQNSAVTINTAATSGGTWSVSGAGATLLYTFTPSAASSTISTTEINDILSGTAVTLTGGATVAAGIPGSVTITSTGGTAAIGSITVASPITAANPSLANTFTLSLVSTGNITVNGSSAIDLTGAAGISSTSVALSSGKFGDGVSITAGAGSTVSIGSSITTSGGNGAQPSSGSTNGGNGGLGGAITVAAPGGLTISGSGTSLTSSGGNGGIPNGNNGSGAGGIGGNIALTVTAGTISITATTTAPVSVLNSSGGTVPNGNNTQAGNGGKAGTINATASGNISVAAGTSLAASGGFTGACTQCTPANVGGAGSTITLSSTGGTVVVNSPINSNGGNGASGGNSTTGSPAGPGGNINVSGAGGVTVAAVLNTTPGTPGVNNGQAPGANGSSAGNIAVTASAGTVAVTAAVNATGGAATGSTNTSTGGTGGIGGSISITASTGINISTGGGLMATGGTGGNSTGNNANGGNGGTGGAISLVGSGFSISQNISAAGGIGGTPNGSGTAGTVGNGSNITINDAGASDVISGIISGLNVSKSSGGNLTLSGANTYKGTTTISAGTLQLGATNTIPSTSNVILSGGTLSSGSGAGFSDQMGTLTISSNSTIHLGTGSNSLKFTAVGATFTGLTVTGWSGSAGNSGTAGQLFVGTTSAGLNTTQLGVTTFTGYPSTGAILATGEVVPVNTGPIVVTTAATSVTTTSAVLNGTFNTRSVSTATTFTIGTTTDAGVGTPASIHTPINSSTAVADSSVAITGLTPNTLYTYKAISGTGSGTDVTFITSPNPPTVGSASNITSTGFTANWTAPNPASEGLAPITYTVEVSTSPTFASGNTFVTGVTGTSAAITGLNTATTYYYRVETVNTTGPSTWSAVSAPVTSNVSNSVACNTGTGAPGNGGTIASSTILPTIDGQVDPVWSSVPANNISNVVVGSIPTTPNTQTWKALWTPDSLYFLVQVNDPTLISQASTGQLAGGTGGNVGGLACSAAVSGASQSSTPPNNEYYNSDGVEITLDGNYSHTAGYNGYSDVQFRFNLGGCSVSGESGGSALNYNGAEFLAVYPKIDYKIITTSTGYNVEAAIPWGTSAASPGINDSTATNAYGAVYAGKNIGLDVQVNDATGTGGRTNQYSWFNFSNATYSSPSTFAQATLQACNQPPVVVLPTHTNITATSAVLGATVDSAGRNSVGAALSIVTSGTAYGTTLAGDSANPAPSTPVATLLTPYTTPVTTGLSPQTKYYHLGYATNSAGITAVSISDSFYTLSQIPTVQPTLSVVPCSKTINWTPVTTFPTAISGQATKTGFIILRTVGTTAPTITGITNRIQPTSFVLPGGTTIVANITANNGTAGSGTTTSFTDASAVSGTTYTYLLVPYSWDGTITDSTYNYYTASAPSISMTYNSVVPTPIFNPLTAICVNGTAPILPTTSTNAITGTWSPATVSNTATGTYTFTPTAGVCANTTTLVQVVNNPTTPTFTALAAICANAVAPVLPTTSTNAITGTWAPATVSNTATGTYTFTPTAGL